MDYDKFKKELNELICCSDWHKRYFSEQARRFSRRDHYLKVLIALTALLGVLLSGSGIEELRFLGAVLAGLAALTMTHILPIFKWDLMISDLKEEQEEWTRIHHGYEDLLRVAEMAEKNEILFQEFQRVREMQKTAALKERNIPRDKELLDRIEKEVRAYYSLDKEQTEEAK